MEFRVEFVDNDGTPTGQPIVLPATTTTKDMNTLINQMLGNEEPTPYSFYVDDNKIMGALSTLAETQSTEKVLKIVYRPEAAFGIRAVSFCSATLPGHSHTILCIAFSNTGLDLATGGGDGSVIFWDMSRQAERQKVPIKENHWIQCIAWHQDCNVVAIAGTDGFVRMLSRSQDDKFYLRNEFQVSTAPVFAIDWEPLHRQDPKFPKIAVATKKGEVAVYCSKTGQRMTAMSGHSAQTMGLAWGADGVIFTCSHDRTIKAWDAESGQELAMYSKKSGAWRTLAISTSYVLRSGAYEAGELVNTDTRRGAEERLLKHKQNSKDEMIAVGGEDFSIALLKYSNRQFHEVSKDRLRGHQKTVNYVSFSPNGYWLASASFDKQVKIWDARSGNFICTLGRGRTGNTGAHMGPVYRVAWSPDSRKLLSGSADTTVKCWDIASQKLLRDLPGHEDEVYGVDWSPSGAPAASGGKDKNVKLWR